MTTNCTSGSHANLTHATLMNMMEEAKGEKTLQRQPLLYEFTAPMGPTHFDMTAEAHRIYKFIVGIDKDKPKQMTEEEANHSLQDPFANLLLKNGKFPLTAHEVIKDFQETSFHPKGLEKFHSFVIAEGGQILWNETTQRMDRSARYVFSMETKEGIGPDVLISTGTHVNSNTQFLQLMSWDPINKAYNFYQRLKAFWIWSGNSYHSLQPESRGKGPFSGHINGGPIMKELRIPWQHWNSMNAVITKEALDPLDPIQNSPYFSNKEGGDIFEKIIESGLHHWNTSRVDTALVRKSVNFDSFLRQLTSTTNVNLTSSVEPSGSITTSSEFSLPFSFFANFRALSIVNIEPIIRQIVIPGSIYLESLRHFEFALESEGVKISGDTHFAFFVPEPAHEDIDLLEKMIEHKIMTARFAACLLMVDFSNPIYSQSRASLQKYMPSFIVNGNSLECEQHFVAKILESKKHLDPTTPEAEFISYWSLEEDYAKTFENMLIDYMELVQQLCQTQEGYNQIVKLAESRRFTFKNTPQFEFDLTFATNNIPSDIFPLEMTKKGIIRPVPANPDRND